MEPPILLVRGGWSYGQTISVIESVLMMIDCSVNLDEMPTYEPQNFSSRSTIFTFFHFLIIGIDRLRLVANQS